MSTIGEIQAYYDRMAASYDQRAATNPFMTVLDCVTWKWIVLHLPKNRSSRILDAGGGTGKWTIPIAKLGYSVTLMDISGEMLGIAKKKIEEQGLTQLISVEQGDMEDMEFPAGFFHFILCEGDALGLTPHPEKALREFKRILKKGGAISLNICNHYKMLPFMINGMKTLEDVEKYFTDVRYAQEPAGGARYRTWRPEEALKLIQAAGFKVETYAPRMVLADLLSHDLVKSIKEDEKMLERVQRIEERLIQHPILAPLGGHVMIIARKPLRSRGRMPEPYEDF